MQTPICSSLISSPRPHLLPSVRSPSPATCKTPLIFIFLVSAMHPLTFFLRQQKTHCTHYTATNACICSKYMYLYRVSPGKSKWNIRTFLLNSLNKRGEVCSMLLDQQLNIFTFFFNFYEKCFNTWNLFFFFKYERNIFLGHRTRGIQLQMEIFIIVQMVYRVSTFDYRIYELEKLIWFWI